MCIRDSLHTDRLHIDSNDPGDPLPDVGNVGGQLRAFGPDAVSYTHLRAHETVLDLVCRLLLEKKKTPIHITQ